MLESLPDHLARQAVTHASWVEQRSDAYERLAFLGDSVLGLAVTTHLYPRLESYGAGRLTKIRAQAVSGRSCRAVAERMGIPERLRAAAPQEVAGPATSCGAAARSRSGMPIRSATERQERPETACARTFVSRPAP